MKFKSGSALLKVSTYIFITIIFCAVSVYCSQAASNAVSGKTAPTVIKISALGDCALGQDSRYPYQNSFDYMVNKQKKNYKYFFSNVVNILSKDDITIANLETSLTNETKKAVKYDYGNNYWFKGSPEYAKILKAGSVEAACLSNNHTYDYMQKGFDDTKKALKAEGIAYFGYGDISYRKVKGITVAMLGLNQLGNYEQGVKLDEFKKILINMTKKAKAGSDLVILSLHWGKEYSYAYNDIQKQLGHLAIDSGADLVIGTHPHVLQPVEKYKGKYIAYSLGNFCFGGTKGARDYDTCIFQQAFTFGNDRKLIQANVPDIIPCSLSSVKDRNDYRPKVAVGSQAESIKRKTRLVSDVVKVSKTDMVRVDSFIKNIVIDLKYATTDNITGAKVYKSNVAYLRRGTAEKLAKASAILIKKGYKIKVWDAYRPSKYQYILWNKAKDKTYFMNPYKAVSVHTRGAAVDITLVKLDGSYVDMPSGFDEQSKKASRAYTLCTPKQKANALLLENAMKSCGFKPLNTEWWHFDDTEYKSYGSIELNI